MIAHLELIEEQIIMILDFYDLSRKERSNLNKCLNLIRKILENEKEDPNFIYSI